MGNLTLDSDSVVDLDIYRILGLNKRGKRVTRSPRVLSILSSSLERSVHRNVKEVVSSKQGIDAATVFNGLNEPVISLRQYIDRIFKYTNCSPSCFVVAQIYIDRFLQETHVHLTSINVHRLLVTSVMLAAKFFDDIYFSNAYYAKVGGVSTMELNRMEMKFLFTLNFRLQVTIETFQTYCYQFKKEAAESLRIERPIRACEIIETWSAKGGTTCAPSTAR